MNTIKYLKCWYLSKKRILLIQCLFFIHHLKVLYSKEKPVDIAEKETGEDKGKRRALPGSISFVPPVAGLLIAGQVIREIAGVE